MEVGFKSLILVGVFNYDLLHQSILVAIPSAEDSTNQEESNHLCLDDPITSSPLILFTKHIWIAYVSFIHFHFHLICSLKAEFFWSRNVRAFNGKAPKPQKILIWCLQHAQGTFWDQWKKQVVLYTSISNTWILTIVWPPVEFGFFTHFLFFTQQTSPISNRIFGDVGSKF